jgi:RHS repeat-associated protein
MLVPNRHEDAKEYRYGFNGKEKDDEIKGGGLQIDYGFRIYDPRIARFLSVDPLTKDYTALTPYQFASNTPIQAIDIDGKEGETYLEYKIENGQEIVLRRVVEVDVYVALSRNKENVHYYSKKEEKDINVAKQTKNDLASQYIDGQFSDGDGHPISWRFNVTTFNVDDISIEDYRQRLMASPTFNIESTIGGKRGARSLIIKQDYLSDLPKFNEKTEQVEFPAGEDSQLNGFFDGAMTITMNNSFVDGKEGRSHTLGHEIAHYMLKLNPDGKISNMINSVKGHNVAGGGILKYFEFDYQITKEAITSGGQSPFRVLTTSKGKEDLNQKNVDEILKSAIDTGKKEVKQP